MSIIGTFYVAVVIFTALRVNGDEVKCSRAEACYPFDYQRGPSCTRGARMNLRFGIEMAPENNYTRYGVPNTEGTYAACPVVDELQAFTLHSAGKYTALALPPTLPGEVMVNETIEMSFTDNRNAWMRAYGYGGNDNVAIPNTDTSTGAVLIMTKDSECPEGEIAFVKFLILSVTMKLGKFVYTNRQNQPMGVGFTPTCDSSSCLLDGSVGCIGPEGRRNCAVCMSPSEAFLANIQVWASYVGTDRNGRRYTSGASNPLNFRAFAGSGVYNSISANIHDIGKRKVKTEVIMENVDAG